MTLVTSGSPRRIEPRTPRVAPARARSPEVAAFQSKGPKAGNRLCSIIGQGASHGRPGGPVPGAPGQRGRLTRSKPDQGMPGPFGLRRPPCGGAMARSKVVAACAKPHTIPVRSSMWAWTEGRKGAAGCPEARPEGLFRLPPYLPPCLPSLSPPVGGRVVRKLVALMLREAVCSAPQPMPEPLPSRPRRDP